MGEFCSLPPMMLKPRPSSVLGSSTTLGWAWPSLAAKAATVAWSGEQSHDQHKKVYFTEKNGYTLSLDVFNLRLHGWMYPTKLYQIKLGCGLWSGFDIMATKFLSVQHCRHHCKRHWQSGYVLTLKSAKPICMLFWCPVHSAQVGGVQQTGGRFI